MGFGINYKDNAPTFLFDGEHRIMISSAINLADRQSGCSKVIRKAMKSKPTPFNLYVYQSETEAVVGKTSDDLLLRYNVNGIELNADGFKKLSEEINLKTLECDIPELHKDRFTIYTGTFPTTTGRYKRLIIREAHVPKINPETMDRDLKAILALKQEGLLGQVLLSHDGNSFRYGGRPPNPYSALFTHFIPYLQEKGFSKTEIRRLTEENPQRALSIKVRAS